MEDIELMQSIKSFEHMNECTPDVILIEGCVLFLMNYYFLVKVSVISELHNNAKFHTKLTRESCFL